MKKRQAPNSPSITDSELPKSIHFGKKKSEYARRADFSPQQRTTTQPRSGSAISGGVAGRDTNKSSGPAG